MVSFNNLDPGQAGQGAAERVGRAYQSTNGAVNRTPGRLGQFQSDDLSTALAAAQGDPDLAAMLVRAAMGQSGRGKGFLSDFRGNRYGKAFQAATALGGLEGFGSTGDIAEQLIAAIQGNTFNDYAGDLGQQAMGLDFSDMGSKQMEAILRSGLGLEGMNMGSLGGAVNTGYLDDLIYSALEREMGDGFGKGDGNFADLLGGSRFQTAMRGLR